MALVASDNPDIVAQIMAMVQLVLGHGGTIHPQARIEESDGDLRVVCAQQGQEGEPLFIIPNALLVPTDRLAWSTRDDRLELLGEPAGLSAVQAELLALFIALFNATGQLARASAQGRMALLRDERFAAQMAAIKPDMGWERASPARDFLNSRVCSTDKVAPDQGLRTYLMPLVVFLNHHAGGSNFFRDGQCQVAITRPTETGECFIRYGKRRDPVDLALGYGFVDRASPFAQSVPVALELAGFGRLELLGRDSGHVSGEVAPQVSFAADGLTLSHFVIDTRAPGRELALLRLAMTASGRARGLAAADVDRAIAAAPGAILAANRARLAEFGAYLAGQADNPFAAMVAQACGCQLANLAAVLEPRRA